MGLARYDLFLQKRGHYMAERNEQTLKGGCLCAWRRSDGGDRACIHGHDRKSAPKTSCKWREIRNDTLDGNLKTSGRLSKMR